MFDSVSACDALYALCRVLRVLYEFNGIVCALSVCVFCHYAIFIDMCRVHIVSS